VQKTKNATQRVISDGLWNKACRKPTKKNKCPAKLVKNGKCNVASGIKCHYKPVQCCGKGKKIYTITAVCISGQWFKAKKMVHCVCHDSSLCRRLKAKQKKKCGRKLGCFVVACNKDGSFKQKQCRGSTGYCWCVNAKGKKVGRSKRGSSSLQCKKAQKCPSKFSSGKCNVASNLKCHYHPMRCCGKGKKIYKLTAVCLKGRWRKFMKMVHCVCRGVKG